MYVSMTCKIINLPTDVGLFDELSFVSGKPFLSSISVSESKMLGSELALLRKVKGYGVRKLFVTLASLLFCFSSVDDSLVLADSGSGEWLKDNTDCGDTAGDIMRRRLIGLEGVRHWSWS